MILPHFSRKKTKAWLIVSLIGLGFFLFLLHFNKKNISNTVVFKQQLWSHSSIITCKVPHIKEGNYKVILHCFVHKDIYPYQNLFLEYSVEDASGKKIVTPQILNFALFDSKTGRPLGDGMLSKIKDHSLELIPTVHLAKSPCYLFHLTHFMRQEKLAGIHKLKLELIPIVASH